MTRVGGTALTRIGLLAACLVLFAFAGCSSSDSSESPGGGGGADTQAPTTPAGLTAGAVSATQVELSWNAASDNVGVAGYRVYRNGVQTGLAAGTSYTSGGLTPSTPYSFTVVAYDAAGNASAGSNALNVTTAPATPGGSNARVLFTDVASIPRNGFVTLWGIDLGTTGTLRVGATALPAGDILYWGPDPNIPWWSRIEFRQSIDGAGAITVDAAVGSLPLAQHAGRLLYVDRNLGDNANNGLAASSQGGGVGPWQTLPYARAQMQLGDVLYVRAGRYGEMDNDTWDSLFHALDMNGTSSRPYAIVGYPGEAPVLDASIAAGVRRFILSGEYWTIAKLRFENGTATLDGSGESKRIVGNVFTNTGPGNSGVVTVQGARHPRVFGNYLFDYGVAGENNSQGIYHGGWESDNTDIEIAYNRLQNQRGGRHIQFYGHVAGERSADIRVHHNHIDSGPYDGILLGRSDGSGSDEWMEGVMVYNNTIRNTNRSCIYMGALGASLNAVVQNNVCYDSVQSSILVTNGSTGTTDIGFNCLDRAVTDNVGAPTSNVHDNDVNHPVCAAGKGHLAF